MITVRPAKSYLKREPFKKKEGANEIDVLVGQNLRKFRNNIGMSQETLGEMVGCTFQQIQKYETGKNRISASRMLILCISLGVTPNSLFSGEK